MQVLKPNHILQCLRSRGKPQVIMSDLVVCYPKQFVPFAVWLESGVLVTHFDKSKALEYTEQGLYLANEYLKERPLSFGILIMRGSTIYSLSRAQLEESLLNA